MAVLGQNIGQTKRLGLSNAFDASNKHVVFVKLTDSSLEALQNYIRKQGNHSSANNKSSSSWKPTIQFSNNSGTFTVPISNEDGSTLQQQKFTFSLSSIDEQQNGPQGSFECLQSRKQGSLESLGPITDKVQVQASDASYIKFGERMSDVKKENEKRTTKYLEDKARNGLVPKSHNIVSEKMRLANKSSHFSTNRATNINNTRFSHTHGGSSGLPRGPPPHSGLSGSHPWLDRKQQKRAQTNSEIMKRPLRDRIVHLLAVRPYKKPELLDRITRDGLRDKDKKELFVVVKSVSTMKDNTYHLKRDIWNDVSEDWPFYTEEERQAFRRRKPQNLTPPGSDGSTASMASGHSSSSSHPASPQPTLKRPSASSSSYLGNGHHHSDHHRGDVSPLSDHHHSHHSPMGMNGSSSSYASPPVNKKKRVSNYVRPADLSPMSNSRSPNPVLTNSTTVSDHHNNHGHKPQQHNHHHSEVIHGSHHHRHSPSVGHSNLKGHSPSAGSLRGHHNGGHHGGGGHGGGAMTTMTESDSMIMDSIVSSSSMEISVESKTNAWLNKTNQDQQQQRDHDQQREQSHSGESNSATSSSSMMANIIPAAINTINSSSSSSSTDDDHMDLNDIGIGTNNSSSKSTSSSNSPRFSKSDYVSKFVKITNMQQRREYKTEFNKDYQRYMDLHGKVEQVSQRFSNLQKKLSQTPKTSPDYKRLKDAIVQDYQNQCNSQFKNKKKEFQYLHHKLEHIKKLVHDYDTRYGGSSNSLNGGHQRSHLTASS